MPIHSNLREGARAERTQFFVEFVQKVHKNALFGLFFFNQKFACGADNFVTLGSLL